MTEQSKESLPAPSGDRALRAVWTAALVVLAVLGVGMLVTGVILGMADKDTTAVWTAFGTLVGAMVGLVGGSAVSTAGPTK